MKTGTKWLIGILVGVVVVVVVASLGVLAWRAISFNNWEYGMRSGRLWDDQPVLPREFNPHMMPMRPFFWQTGSWYGFFGLGRILIGALLCLVVPVLLIIGVVLLLRNSQNPPQPVSSQPAPVPPPTASIHEPVEASSQDMKLCSHCGRQVQEDWSHCPYCGNTL